MDIDSKLSLGKRRVRAILGPIVIRQTIHFLSSMCGNRLGSCLPLRIQHFRKSQPVFAIEVTRSCPAAMPFNIQSRSSYLNDLMMR